MRQHCFFAFLFFILLNFSPAFAETQKVHGFEVYPVSGQVESQQETPQPVTPETDSGESITPVQEDEPAPQPVATEPVPAPKPQPEAG